LKVRKKSVLHPRGEWFKGDVTKKANNCGAEGRETGLRGPVSGVDTAKKEEDHKRYGITGFTI